MTQASEPGHQRAVASAPRRVGGASLELLLAVTAFTIGHISGLQKSAKVLAALCVPAVDGRQLVSR